MNTSILLLAAPKDPLLGRSGQPFPRGFERLGELVDGRIMGIGSPLEPTDRCYPYARPLGQFFLRKSCSLSHCRQSWYRDASGVVCHVAVCTPPVWLHTT